MDEIEWDEPSEPVEDELPIEAAEADVAEQRAEVPLPDEPGEPL